MTLEQKIGQFFFPAVFINETEENIIATEELIKKFNIGGLTFFHSRASAATNYESKTKIIFNDDSYQRLKDLVARYQKCAPTPLLICIDAEWGLAMRVEKTPQYPYAITLGALPFEQADLVRAVGRQIGLDLKSAGIHYNLAPLADINNNPNNPVIGYRSFGENKEKVAHFAIEYLKGMSEVGVLGCLKHFPGHGNTNVDSHLGLPILNESLEELLENELYPFIKGIENQVDSIMIGHLAVPALNDGKDTSATLSKNIIEKLLRDQLKYEGLIISDALNMHSVSKLYNQKGQLEWEAFNAGNDILCFAENIAEGIQEILKNATESRIEASYKRLMICKEKAGLFNHNNLENPELDFEATAFLNHKIAQQSLTIVKDTNNFELINQASKKEKLAILNIYSDSNNTFSNTLKATGLKASLFSIQKETIDSIVFLEKELKTFDCLVLALFVPKAKPYNNFEIDTVVLDFISSLLTTKKCVLYLFGNPYSLQVIPNLNAANGIIQVYQYFDVFQENAALQLTQNNSTYGSLPVMIPKVAII